MSRFDPFWRKQKELHDLHWTNVSLARDGFPPLHEMTPAQLTEALANTEAQIAQLEAKLRQSMKTGDKR